MKGRNFSGAESCEGATVGEHEAAPDPAAERRCAKAVGMLSERSRSRYAMIVEAGPPPVLGLAIHGVAYGELMLPADYDPVLLLALIEQHGDSDH